jgi:hypothetical protein
VDVVASATAEQYGHALRLLGAAGEIDAIITVYIPPFVTAAEDVAREITAAATALPAKPVIAVFMTAVPAPASLSSAGIPAFTYPEQAAAALGQIARWAEWRARPAGHVVTPPTSTRAAAGHWLARSWPASPAEDGPALRPPRSCSPPTASPPPGPAWSAPRRRPRPPRPVHPELCRQEPDQCGEDRARSAQSSRGRG